MFIILLVVIFLFSFSYYRWLTIAVGDQFQRGGKIEEWKLGSWYLNPLYPTDRYSHCG